MTGRPVTSIRAHREIKDGDPTMVPMTTMHRPRPAQAPSDGSALRVLVVDDEPSLAELLSMALRYEGWEVRTAADGATAVALRPRLPARRRRARRACCPTWTGSRCCAGCAAERPSVPVLFLTAKDAVEDRIAGLTAGGDDYVTKPFSLEEVVARLRGLLRRDRAGAARDDGRCSSSAT